MRQSRFLHAHRRMIGWSLLGCVVGCCFGLDLFPGVWTSLRVAYAAEGGPTFYGRYSGPPTPELGSAGNCSAQVTLSWNVESVAGANGAYWELKIGQDFSNPNGPEPIRAAHGPGGVTGSKTLDLRKYGPYLTGQTYYFRVVAKEGNKDLTPRSQAVTHTASVFEADVTLSETGGQVVMSWNLTQDQQACSDASFYEVDDQPFTSPGKQNGRLYHGKVSGPSGSKTFNLAQHGDGTYYFRVVGKYNGGQPKRDIGVRARPGDAHIIQPEDSTDGFTGGWDAIELE